MAKFSPDSVTSPVAPSEPPRDAGYYSRLRLRVRIALLTATIVPLLGLAGYLVARYDELLVIGGVTLLAVAAIVGLVLYFTGQLVRRLSVGDHNQEALRQELFHAAKLASVGEMAAGVAHEINNPLAIIHEEAGMMSDQLDPELGSGFDEADFRERLESISEAALRGRNITRKLLAFSRQYEPKPEPTDVTEVADRAITSRERTFSLSEIDIVRRLSDDLPKVMVKGGQLEQVILNLLNNARDAIGTDGSIEVSTRLDGDMVVCCVQDSGPGIPEELMPQIFFPFFTTKGVGKGTGLGLSISYGIIKSFDGRIEVESEEGKGTTFRIHLPCPMTGDEHE